MKKITPAEKRKATLAEKKRQKRAQEVLEMISDEVWDERGKRLNHFISKMRDNK